MALSGDTLLEEVSLRYWLWESKALLNFKSAFSVSCTLTSETMNQNRSLLPESALAEVFVTAAEANYAAHPHLAKLRRGRTLGSSKARLTGSSPPPPLRCDIPLWDPGLISEVLSTMRPLHPVDMGTNLSPDLGSIQGQL